MPTKDGHRAGFGCNSGSSRLSYRRYAGNRPDGIGGNEPYASCRFRPWLAYLLAFFGCTGEHDLYRIGCAIMSYSLLGGDAQSDYALVAPPQTTGA